MKGFFKSPLQFATLIAIVFLSSCTKDEYLDIDLGLASYPDNTIILDELVVKTVKDDSLRTDNLNFHLIGTTNDPVFGVTKASINTQIGLLGIIDVPKNAVLDSMVLRLRYLGSYGDNEFSHNIVVNQLEEGLNQSRSYYNTSEVKKGSVIGTIDNTKFNAATNPYISIRIDDLWNNTDFFVGQTYNGSSEFQEKVKGISIESTSIANENEGNIGYFNLVDINSGITAYYHTFQQENGQLVEEYSSIQFQLVSDVKTFSKVENNESGSMIEQYLNADSSNTAYAFAKAFGSSHIQVSTPQMKQLADSGALAFHKVELVMPIAEEYTSDIFSVASFLDIKYQDTTGALNSPADESKPYWTRAYSSDDKAYVYNLTSYYQSVLLEYKSDPNYIQPVLNLSLVKNNPIAFSAGRVVLKGSKAKNGAFLRIYYSKIELL